MPPKIVSDGLSAEEGLLEFVCGFGRYDSERALLGELQDFLVGSIGAGLPMVFSSGLDKGGHWRLCWHRPVGRLEGDRGVLPGGVGAVYRGDMSPSPGSPITSSPWGSRATR